MKKLYFIIKHFISNIFIRDCRSDMDKYLSHLPPEFWDKLEKQNNDQLASLKDLYKG